MPVEAKVSPNTAGINSAPVQAVEGSVNVPAGSNVALNVAPDAIAGYGREGADLLVHLKSGEMVRIANFYVDPSKVSHLLLVNENGLVTAEVAEVTSGAMSSATYVPIDATAGFSAPAAGAAAGGSAGTAAGAAAAGAGGGVLGAGTLIPLAVLAGGGLAAATASGGGDDERAVPVPPDTTAPGAASNLAINAAGDRLTGNAEAGATVNVDVDRNGSSDYSVTVGANGTFSVALAPPLVDGETVRVTVRDAAGNISPAASLTAPDTTEPAPAEGVTIAADGTGLSGTGEPGSTVSVDVGQDGIIDYTTQVAADGTFIIRFLAAIDNGQEIDVTITDPDGNQSEPVPLIAPDLSPTPATAPILAPTNGSVFSGTAQSGIAVVLVDEAGNTIGRAAIGAGGAWSLTPATPLPDGAVVRAAAVNALGEAGPAAVVTVDAVPPAAPVIAPSNGTAIAGTAEAGATMLLSDANGNPLGQVTADAAGAWTFAPAAPLADGTTVNAAARDAAGNGSAQTSTVIDAAAPTAPTISPPNGAGVSGTAEPGSTIILTDGSGNAIGQATASITGVWSFTPATPFADGTVINAAARDAAGNTGPQTTATVDGAAPAVPLINPSNGAVLSGTAEAGALVTLADGNGNPIAEVTADGSGAWTFIPLSPLPGGTVIVVTARDGVGNTSPQATTTIDATAPAAPTIAPTNGFVVSGTAEAGALVTLTDGGGNPIAQVTADGTGAWSLTLGSPLANGALVNASARDAAGNTGPQATATVDAIAPPSPVIAQANGTVLTGTAEAGSTVILTDGAGNPIGQTAVDGTGNWAFTPATPLADGTVVGVAAKDAAGNESPQAFAEVDAVAPAPPAIDPSNGAVLAGTAEPGATIVLTDGNGNPLGQVATDINGNWSFTPAAPVPDGTVVGAVALDAAGNASVQATATIDAAAPPAPTIDPSNGVQLVGTAEAGAIITLTDGNGNPIGQTTVDIDGNWAFTPAAPLPDGTVVNASAQDLAGNSSLQSTVTVDGVAPLSPIIDPSDGSEITGSAETGALVIITDGNGDPIGEVTADIDGLWSFTPGSSLSNGTVVNAIAQDKAGNASGPSSTTVDSTTPVEPTINPTNGSEVSGTAEPNSNVILMDGTGNIFARATIPEFGLPIGQVTADDNGNWTFTPLLPLPDGTVVIAISVDAAGNVSSAVDTIVDGVAPLTPTIDPTTGFELAGTAEAGATILLTDILGDPIGETTADDDGNWSFTPLVPLPNGLLVNAVAVDAAGNDSLSVSTVVDSIIPPSPIINASNGATLTGTAEPDATVILTNALGGTIAEVAADSNGNWSFTPLVPLPNATVVVAVAQDAVGNVSFPAFTSIDTIVPNSVFLTLSSNGSLLTGFAEPNSQLSIVIDNDTANPITVNVNIAGTFALPFVPPLVAGETISAVAIDAAGNQSTPTAIIAPDIEPPTIALLEAPEGWINAAEAADGIQVEVFLRPTMQVGQVITAQFDGQNGYEAEAIHVLDAGDIALGVVVLSIQPPGGQGPLPEGASAITASVGAGALSAPVGFTIDTTPPATPLLSLTNSLLSISAEPGSELNVDVDLGAVTANAVLTADNNGLASLNLLADLDVGLSWDQLLAAQVSVTGEDPAGNATNVATLPILSGIEQPLTIGNLAVDASLNLLDLRLGISGTTDPNSSLAIRVITPLVDVELLPITADGSGNFSLNLLSPTILSQLGLDVADLLNFGEETSLNLVATNSQGHESASYGVDLVPGGLWLNIGQVAVNGTTGDDVMSGANGSAEHINSGSGNDLILNVGAGDHVSASNADDTIEITAPDFATIDGGAGFDTLLLSNGINLDYNAVGVGTLTNIERIDLGTGDGGSVLTLTAPEVDAITDVGNVLQITGESNDVLNVAGAVDTGTTQLHNGIVFDVYTFGVNTLLVEDNAVQVVV
jgi:hypothetical protein